MQVCLVCFLFLIQLHVTEGCTLAGNPELILVTAYTGGSATLPCTCTNLQSKPETVTWLKYTNPNGWVEISPESEQYKDRVQLANDLSPGNLSLIISHLTVEDDGYYRCTVKGREFRDVRLTVKGCTLTQQPEKVIGIVGQSVLLSCSCSELQAKPRTFTWIFYKGSNHIQIFPNNERNRYTDRVQFFTDRSPGNLSLLISQLSLQDEGWYRCEISNHQLRDIQLTVKDATPTPSPDSEPESLPYIPVALVTVVFLHMIVAGVYCTTRKKGPGRVHYSRDDGDGDGDGAVSLQ